jgi:hypothetical protein
MPSFVKTPWPSYLPSLNSPAYVDCETLAQRKLGELLRKWHKHGCSMTQGVESACSRASI